MSPLHFDPTERIYINSEVSLIPYSYTSVKTGPQKDLRARDKLWTKAGKQKVRAGSLEQRVLRLVILFVCVLENSLAFWIYIYRLWCVLSSTEVLKKKIHDKFLKAYPYALGSNFRAG